MNKQVSFELALLLAENKYDISTDSLYVNNSLIYANGRKCNWNLEEDYDDIPEPVSAPTIADVVMWLYEKHGIWLYCEIKGDNFYVKAKRIKSNWRRVVSGVVDNENILFNSPIEAYEAGIKYCLEKVI